MGAPEPDPLEGFNREEALTEEHSFDELARWLASSALPRSRALRLAGAAFLAGALGALGLWNPAEAKRRRRRRRAASCTFCGTVAGLSPDCQPGQSCNIIANGIGCCVPICTTTDCSTGCACRGPGDETCQGGTCVCTNFTHCAGSSRVNVACGPSNTGEVLRRVNGQQCVCACTITGTACDADVDCAAAGQVCAIHPLQVGNICDETIKVCVGACP